MEDIFDYNLQPGKELKSLKYKESSVVISVIIPYYNAAEYVDGTLYSVLNQTYPFFEVLIVNDGSTDKESVKKLKSLAKIDKRIKILDKENEGLAATRDYGAQHAASSSKYLFFIDADDLIEPTYLECALWTLETHPDAAWCYSDSVGFDSYTYKWNRWFDSAKMKKVNELVATALIRKDIFNSVGGFELRIKAVNEDWNFWLKMLSKGYYPVHMSFYGFWYRRKENGSELKKAKENHKINSKIIKESAKKVTKRVDAIQFPKYFENDEVKYDIDVPGIEDDRINILIIIPWMVMGGADRFNLEYIKGLDKDKYNVIILSTLPSTNIYRQKFEQYATVYDLTSFLEQKDWLNFIDYIVNKHNIKIIFNTNSECGYAMIPYLKVKYPNIPIVDYVHMEEWYYNNGGFARFSSDCSDYIDMTFVCNNNTEKVLKSYFKRSKDEVKTIYIGVDPDVYNPNNYDKKELLDKYNLTDNNKYIISYICRISAQKRPMLLANIIEKAIERRKDILFLIVGDGDMLPSLKEYVSNKNLEDNVLFLGNIEEPEEIYAISDFTINCSIKEGLALTSYESLSMGVPVLSCDVGGQKELIDDKVGKIVPCLQEEKDINIHDYSDEEINNYVDGIDYIISNLDDLKKNCRKRILDNYTLDKMVNNLSSEFSKIVSNPNKKKISAGEKGNLVKCKKEVFDYFEKEQDTYSYLVREYQKNVYGRYLTDENGNNLYNSKKELLKEKLWQYSWWKKFTSSKIWKLAKRIKNR